jgi:hypothetical protein
MKAALLAIVCTAACPSGALPGCARPDRTTQPAAAPQGSDRMGPLRLSDDDFWTDPTRTRDEVQGPYMSEGREVLFFDAPSVVPLEARETAPTQALRVATFDTLSQRPFRKSAIVTAVDIANNRVYADVAVRPSGRESDPTPRKYTGPPVKGMGTEVFTIELRERLALPWEAGRYLARLLIADQITDPRTIEFKPGGFIDPAVEKFREQERTRTNVPALAPAPGPGLAIFRQDKQSPALPPSEGLALSAPRVLDLDQPGPCFLRGSFRLPVLRRHLVPQGTKAGAEPLFDQLKNQPAGTPQPTAVVPITLVGTGSSMAGPYVWRLMIPTFDRVDASDQRPVVTGFFSIDLRTLNGFDTTQQTMYLYALSDRAVAGPVTVGLTRPPK